MFETVELHNRRHRDSGPLQTQIPQQYRLRKESKERKKQLELTVPFETILSLFPTHGKIQFIASESND